MGLAQKQTWRQWIRRPRHKPTGAVTWFLLKELKMCIAENVSLFNKWYWENWIFPCRRLKLDPCLSPCTNTIPSGSNILMWDLTLLQERRKTLEAVGTGSRAPKGQVIKRKFHKWKHASMESIHGNVTTNTLDN
jgi:hypothetical protein